jgi:hypothetical protein
MYSVTEDGKGDVCEGPRWARTAEVTMTDVWCGSKLDPDLTRVERDAHPVSKSSIMGISIRQRTIETFYILNGFLLIPYVSLLSFPMVKCGSGYVLAAYLRVVRGVVVNRVKRYKIGTDAIERWLGVQSTYGQGFRTAHTKSFFGPEECDENA